VPIEAACTVDRFSVLAWVSLLVTELAIVISRPSRIQAVPGPSTSRVWNGDQRSRSSRAGMVLRIGCCSFVAMVVMRRQIPQRRLLRRRPCALLLLGEDPVNVGRILGSGPNFVKRSALPGWAPWRSPLPLYRSLSHYGVT
jgi:hypothetical protein